MLKDTIAKSLIALMLLTGGLTLSACNTTEGVGEETQHASLHGRGGGTHLVDGHPVVEERAHQVGESGGRKRRRDLMSHEAAMVEMGGRRDHALEERLETPVAATLRERPGEGGERLLGVETRQHGHSLPVERACQVVGEEIDDAMAVGPEGLRIEGAREEPGIASVHGAAG